MSDETQYTLGGDRRKQHTNAYYKYNGFKIKINQNEL